MRTDEDAFADTESRRWESSHEYRFHCSRLGDRFCALELRHWDNELGQGTGE